MVVIRQTGAVKRGFPPCLEAEGDQLMGKSHEIAVLCLTRADLGTTLTFESVPS